MEGVVGPSLFEPFDRSVHSLSGSSEGAAGQHLDLLGVSNFCSRVNDLLSCLKEFLGEVSEL